MNKIKIIIGLGNKGIKYRQSRHNLGFMVIDALCKAHNIKLRKEEEAYIGKLNNNIILAKPLSYMNISGKIIKKLLSKYNISKDEILIIVDDINLELGRIKIKKRGSSGGHKGLSSVIEELQSEDFARIRIGIDKPTDKSCIKEYVLSQFSKEQLPIIKGAIKRAVELVTSIIIHGLDKTISKTW